MTERPALSKGEMEVARVLWELRSASVRQVHQVRLAAAPAARTWWQVGAVDDLQGWTSCGWWHGSSALFCSGSRLLRKKADGGPLHDLDLCNDFRRMLMDALHMRRGRPNGRTVLQETASLIGLLSLLC